MSRYAQDMTEFKARTIITNALEFLPRPPDHGKTPEGFCRVTVKYTRKGHP